MEERLRFPEGGRLLCAVAAALALAAASARGGYSSTSLIDIPGSEYLDHLQYEGDFVVAVSDDANIPNYGVLNVNLGVAGMAEVGAAVYSFWDEAALAAHFKVEVMDEERYRWWQPSLSLGMDNLTIGDGIISRGGNRLPRDTAAYDMDFSDNLSPYVVASKTFGPIGTFHVGWGAGRFVGQGPYSDYFHGVFLGYNRRVWGKLEVVVEEDGRDVNLGIRHTFPWVTVGTALEKVEQIGRDYSPFYSITLEVSPRPLHAGPERLAMRREINAVASEVREFKRALLAEAGSVNALQTRVGDLKAQYRRDAVSQAELEQLNAEIERIKKELDAAGETKKTPAGVKAPATGI